MCLSESLTLKRLSSFGGGKLWAVYFVVELLKQNVYSSPKSKPVRFLQRRK